MASVRQRVVRRIAERAKLFPQLDPTPLSLGTGFGDGRDDPRDIALAHAIDHAVARRWLTLTAVLQSRLKRPWEQVEPSLQAVLLAGTAQLLLLERVPDHAAVDESVRIARRLVRTGAAGFANAVLRQVADLRRETVPGYDLERRDELPLGDGRAWRLAENVFGADDQQRLSETTSHPEALIRRWGRTLPRIESATEVALHDLVQAPLIVTGVPSTVDRPDLIPHEEEGFFVFSGGIDVLHALLEEHPDARVQDPTSALPVSATRIEDRVGRGRSPRLIIDACAGKGTKTRQLAALYPDARVIAADVDERRDRVLRQTFAGAAQVTVKTFDELQSHRGEADLLLLDVPCSNTGVLARRVEARYRVSASSLQSLVDLQRSIVATTLPLLTPSGRLLYATCSMESEENEQQVEWIASSHRMKVISTRLHLPQGQPGEATTHYRDGGFYGTLEGR